MSYLRTARNLVRSLHVSFGTRCPPRRAVSINARPRDSLYDYTSGRWIINDALRHAERRRVFNVDAMCRLAAQSVHRSPDDVVDLRKLAEGGANRTFLITMRDGFQLVARIPYPVTAPKYFAVASEVATMAFLRSSGLPVPQIYGYSPTPNNAAETEYIFMEFFRGTDLTDIWFELEEEDIISVSRQIAELESKMMSITFPAAGSLYYAKDLSQVAVRSGIPLEDPRFCIGPDTRLALWFGRRSQLDVDRGPYKSAEAVLAKAADKEVAYLERFGRPLLPFNRLRREHYQYKEQQPSDHIENLHRYLLIASSLAPNNAAIRRFGIRHPDLQPGNIFVSRSSDSKLHVAGLIDWQHTSILPTFLFSGIPGGFQNYGDPVSEHMAPPSLPDNFGSLDENAQSREKEVHRRRLVHYHYVKNTEEYNPLHYAALTYPTSMLRRRLFSHASDPWEGETLALKVALIEATKKWGALTGGDLPCPITFDADDVRRTMELDKVQTGADDTLEACRKGIGMASDGWVPTEHYEAALALCKSLKEAALASAESDKDRSDIAGHWPFDDMDEEPYS